MIRELVKAFAESFASEVGSGKLLARREIALTDLALILDPDETAILDAADVASSLVASTDKAEAATAFVEISRLLPSWHRGEISSRELRDEFSRVMNDSRPDGN